MAENKSRKLQPTAEVMREQLALAATEIIRLRAALQARSPSAGVVFAIGGLAGAVLTAVGVWLA